jgi:hypothetical protein
MMLITLQMQINKQENLQNHYIYVTFAKYSNFKIWSPGNILFSTMSTIMPVLNLILPVLDAVFCEQT